MWAGPPTYSIIRATVAFRPFGGGDVARGEPARAVESLRTAASACFRIIRRIIRTVGLLQAGGPCVAAVGFLWGPQRESSGAVDELRMRLQAGCPLRINLQGPCRIL